MLGHLSHHDFEREGGDKSAMVFGGGVNIGDNICQKRVGIKKVGRGKILKEKGRKMTDKQKGKIESREKKRSKDALSSRFFVAWTLIVIRERENVGRGRVGVDPYMAPCGGARGSD
jgi:hypothetical protein